MSTVAFVYHPPSVLDITLKWECLLDTNRGLRLSPTRYYFRLTMSIDHQVSTLAFD